MINIGEKLKLLNQSEDFSFSSDFQHLDHIRGVISLIDVIRYPI